MNDHRYHPALDGLRAVAVICVVLFHAGATSGLADLAPGGFIGVSVFFTLSGYLVMTVLLREIADSGGLDVSRFWARRIRRLAPASLTVVVGAVVLAPLFWTGFRWVDAAAGIFGYTNWHVIVSGEGQLLRTIVGPLGPFWSLAVEEQFYVLLTIAVLVAVHTKQPVRTLSFMVIAGWIGSLLVQLLLSGPQLRVEFGTDARGTELLAGCGLALVLHVRPEALRHQPFGSCQPASSGSLRSSRSPRPPTTTHRGYSGAATQPCRLSARYSWPRCCFPAHSRGSWLRRRSWQSAG